MEASAAPSADHSVLVQASWVPVPGRFFARAFAEVAETFFYDCEQLTRFDDLLGFSISKASKLVAPLLEDLMMRAAPSRLSMATGSPQLLPGKTS